MKLQVALALALSWLASADSYSQSQPARSAQNEPAASQTAKHQLLLALARDPNDTKALFQLGRLMADEGDFASAGPLFQKYVAISPGEPEHGPICSVAPWVNTMCERQTPRSAKSKCWHRQTSLCMHRPPAGWPVPGLPK